MENIIQLNIITVSLDFSTKVFKLFLPINLTFYYISGGGYYVERKRNHASRRMGQRKVGEWRINNWVYLKYTFIKWNGESECS
jgi:hypothetical protein